MYVVGDRVVYGAFGVMEIVDVTEQTFGDVTKQYYVMREYSSSSSSLTYVPFDNEMLLSQMKPLLTKDEIVDVIRLAKASAPLEWVEDNRARSEKYKKMLSMSDRALLLAMIETVYQTGLKREAEGKKNYIADENSMNRAIKLISTEFALVLGITEAEVPEYVRSIK